MTRFGLLAAGCVIATAAPAAAQTIDEEAVQAACGALEAQAVAGRARLVDVVACANRETARQLNPQMPLQVDQLTTVTSIDAVAAQLIYNVRIDIDGTAVSAANRQQLATETRNFVCNAPDMRTTIGNGGSYRYRWVDRSGASLGEALIDRC